jgi:sRNA-binding regulator protein Hfq
MSLMSDSVLYTIGTALNRAHDNGATVQVLVEGQWLDGQVAAVDGHGVVLADELEQSVIRMSSVSAVRMVTVAPVRTPLPEAAHPMPAA